MYPLLFVWTPWVDTIKGKDAEQHKLLAAYIPDTAKDFLIDPDLAKFSIFNGLVETLLAMANYRPMPETSIIHFVRYPADTLYVLAENQDLIVAQLVDFGKKWRADSVDIFDGNHNENNDEDWSFQDYVSIRLKRALSRFPG
jgi:hypothetical protein